MLMQFKVCVLAYPLQVAVADIPEKVQKLGGCETAT